MPDLFIIGAGIIGLSLAWELAKHGYKVQIIDQGQPGREASWAGAGILSPATVHAHQHPYDQLRGLAFQLHPKWADELKVMTGIDTGYRRCGGLHLARTPGETASLSAWAALALEEGLTIERLSQTELAQVEPGLDSTQYSVLNTQFSVPDESQLRNPWHLRALLRACELSGVTITPDTTTSEFVLSSGELVALKTPSGTLEARQYCFSAGAWTGQILQRLGIAVGVLPIRGQMVLFRCDKPPIKRIINEGSRYLVPRDDGHVLAGSTEEEVGFDKRTTDEAISDLTNFARGLVPALRDAPIEQTWAGLRPASFDGLPYLGRLPRLNNAFIAAGHFRSGLFLSPATAVVMSQLIRGETPQVDLAPFRLGR